MRRLYYVEKFNQGLYYPIAAISSTSPRKLLIVLNFIIFFCGIYYALYGAYVIQLLYDPSYFTGWINWSILMVVGVFIAIAAIIGMRGAHLVNLELLLTYFWGIIILISPLGIGLFAVFNISFYTNIWIKHQWDTDSFQSLRELFCEKGTSDNKCKAPLYDTNGDDDNGNYNNTLTWCLSLYNATDCTAIRNSAIRECNKWGSSLILGNSVIGLGCFVIMIVCIYITVDILTPPVITQSMLDIINYLLLLPIGACIWQSIGFWNLQGLGLTLGWLPQLYIGLAIGQLVAFPLGIISGRLKSRPLLVVYIILTVFIVGGFVIAFIVAWTLSKVVLTTYQPTNKEINEIACDKHLPGCSECNQTPPNCPEWSSNDILTLFALDLRLTGMVSLLGMLYILGALIVAFIVENSLKNYKSDFV